MLPGQDVKRPRRASDADADRRLPGAAAEHRASPSPSLANDYATPARSNRLACRSTSAPYLHVCTRRMTAFIQLAEPVALGEEHSLASSHCVSSDGWLRSAVAGASWVVWFCLPFRAPAFTAACSLTSASLFCHHGMLLQHWHLSQLPAHDVPVISSYPLGIFGISLVDDGLMPTRPTVICFGG